MRGTLHNTLILYDTASRLYNLRLADVAWKMDLGTTGECRLAGKKGAPCIFSVILSITKIPQGWLLFS